VSGLSRACVERQCGLGGSLLAGGPDSTATSLDRLADAIDQLGFDGSAKACSALRNSCGRLHVSFAQSRGTRTLQLDSDDHPAAVGDPLPVRRHIWTQQAL
jgi:hypothetical protein